MVDKKRIAKLKLLGGYGGQRQQEKRMERNARTYGVPAEHVCYSRKKDHFHKNKYNSENQRSD